jgi:hypothetical protein
VATIGIQMIRPKLETGAQARRSKRDSMADHADHDDDAERKAQDDASPPASQPAPGHLVDKIA